MKKSWAEIMDEIERGRTLYPEQTTGSRVAREGRIMCNNMTDEERKQARKRANELIYSVPHKGWTVTQPAPPKWQVKKLHWYQERDALVGRLFNFEYKLFKNLKGRVTIQYTTDSGNVRYMNVTPDTFEEAQKIAQEDFEAEVKDIIQICTEGLVELRGSEEKK